jgi:folate-binding protein YgfZ
MNNPDSSASQAPALQGQTPLTHLGVIRVQGEDASKFLQGQLTQDFALLGLSEARLAAFCNAKGRMQATFIGFKRSHDEILLICSRDLLAATLKRLSMFVMRAKAKLTDATADYSLLGLAGSAIERVASRSYRAWEKSDFDYFSIVGLYPAAGSARALLVAPVQTQAVQIAIPAEALSRDLWLWGEVMSGVATLTQPVFEAFVPQMLNYESVGGVSFKKGCYPGQEVVARSQFRGTLKRRAYLLHADAPLHSGQEVFESADPDQPCGIVVQSAVSPQGGFDAIVSMQTSAAQGSRITLGSASGPELSLLVLPYPLLEDL